MGLWNRKDSRRRHRVLVVDDEPDICALLETALTAAGFEAASAGDGIAGLEAIARFRPDVVILDIKMPRMNGFEMLIRLREQPRWKDLPVVVLTSVADESLKSPEEWCESLGVCAFFHKPFDPGVLLEKVAEIVEGKAAEKD